MKKTLIILLIMALMLSGLVGCSNKDEADSTQDNQVSQATEAKQEEASTEETVKITFLNTKGEIQAQLEEMAVVFTSETGIEMEVLPTGAGTSPFEKMTALYASGNAPSISMIDVGDLPSFEDKMYDLSNEKWINDAMPGSLEIANINGKQLAFPFAVEGFGLIYNKTAIETAIGDTFDPSTIKSRSDLEALFQKIEAGGTAPVVISPLDWSLAAHYLSIPYSIEGVNLEGRLRIMEEQKAGTYDLSSSEAFNSTMDTMDMMLEYNLDKDDPMSGTYESGAAAVATGEAAFWFMGNWAWPQIDELSETKEFGFIPVPIDGVPNGLSAGPTKYVAVDRDQNSPEQVEAALTFLNWLVYEESGQKGLVKDCSIIPAYTNIELAPDDALAESILAHMADGNTIPMVYSLPSDHWAEVGAYMQSYISGFSTRDDMYESIMNYWSTVE